MAQFWCQRGYQVALVEAGEEERARVLAADLFARRSLLGNTFITPDEVSIRRATPEDLDAWHALTGS